MEGVRLTVFLIIAIALQWTLRNLFEAAVYVDFPLIVVVYAALQRNAIRAILFGTISGIAVDALSGGLLGSSGFSKTLIAFIVSEIARRVYMDNLLLRIPVLAGASLLHGVLYFGLHRLLSQPPTGDAVVVIAYSLLATTIAGTLIYMLLQNMATDRTPHRKREMFAPRRQTRRRNPIRLTK